MNILWEQEKHEEMMADERYYQILEVGKQMDK